MGGVAAVDLDAQVTRRSTDVLLAARASGTSAAADPGIDRDRAAVLDIAARAAGSINCGRSLRAGTLDHAGDLVAEREGQGAARSHVELLVVAEQEIAVLHVQVRMAHAAAMNADQNLGAGRFGAVDNRLA